VAPATTRLTPQLVGISVESSRLTTFGTATIQEPYIGSCTCKLITVEAFILSQVDMKTTVYWYIVRNVSYCHV